jgi:arylformamidase
MYMNIIDISWPIQEGMTEYKDRKSVKITQSRTIAEGACEYMLQMHNHIGTHVDAPAHMLADGKTIDQIDLQQLIGPAQVIDCTNVVEVITADDLAKHTIKSGNIILLQTRNSFRPLQERFDYAFAFLAPSAAKYLIEKKIKAFGFDYLSIERTYKGEDYDYLGIKKDVSGHEVHIMFMNNNIPIIEGLRLNDVKAGNYMFYCLPLALQGADSAPARALLIEEK